MLRKSYLLAAVAVMFVLPALAKAQFQQGNWDLNLNGSGVSDKEVKNTSTSVGAQLGYLLSPELEVGVRQSVSYAKVNHGGESYSGTTVGFVDYHFNLGAWQPFVGGNVGLGYGNHRTGTGAFGPEVGVKYFINSTTYAFGILAYEMSTSNTSNADWVYTVGLGVALK